MTKGTLSIHSENILPIIKKWLYSEKDIFVRELVSNACDAIHKVKILGDRGEAQVTEEEFRIDIEVDKEARELRFIDTGIGMTADEVEKYIAQLAFSGAEDFVEKYQGNDEGEQIIGHFGLGFYSSYMVSERVSLQTKSYQEGSQPAAWSCDGSSSYDLDEGSRSERGTAITLHVDEENDEFLDPARMREILNRFCSFLPYPIHLNGERINAHDPLWLKPASECTDEDYLNFFRQLHPMEPDPLFWIHLNVDYPFNLKGILYFPKIRRDHDFQKTAIQLYCNRVFVSDNCKDLLPEYLMMLKGAIDSPDIPLNVSRSYLQTDRTVRQVATHIAKKVCDRLSGLYKTDREKFLQTWPDLELIVKLGCMQDDKFYEKAKDFLVWKNSAGEWTTLEDYQSRNKEALGDKIFYAGHEKQQSAFLEVYKKKGIEVLHTNPMIDTHLLAFLEQKLAPSTFQRIDAAVEDVILDKEREKVVLDESGRSAAAVTADWVRQALESKNIEVEAKSLASEELPAFLMIDEQGRRMRDFMRQNSPDMGTEMLEGMTKRTLVVNTNSPLIDATEKLGQAEPELAKEVMQQVYELALLSQRELEPEQLHQFIGRSQSVLQDLVQRASK